MIPTPRQLRALLDALNVAAAAAREAYELAQRGGDADATQAAVIDRLATCDRRVREAFPLARELAQQAVSSFVRSAPDGTSAAGSPACATDDELTPVTAWCAGGPI